MKKLTREKVLHLIREIQQLRDDVRTHGQHFSAVPEFVQTRLIRLSTLAEELQDEM